MIRIENAETMGWEHAIRGMRNPMNSWDKSDSVSCQNTPCGECRFFVDSHCVSKNPGGEFAVGENDHKLMIQLAKGGSVHAKYRRMIAVYLDITAPLYWWKEYDTYKVGTVANSCSTMHKIHAKAFELDDFSHEHLDVRAIELLENIICALNNYRDLYVNYNADDFEITGCPSKKDIWWQMIQLLPASYSQKRTVMLNYEVLTSIYRDRKGHKLDEWHTFCDWIESLPYSELITGGSADE